MSNELSKVNNEKDTKNEAYFIPRVDVSYNEEETVILADMPGVDNEGVDVSIKGDELVVTGQNSVSIPKSFNIKWQEYKLGNYRKSFKMTDTVDTQKISAVMKDGVLKLVLPNKKQSIPVKIKVKAG